MLHSEETEDRLIITISERPALFCITEKENKANSVSIFTPSFPFSIPTADGLDKAVLSYLTVCQNFFKT